MKQYYQPFQPVLTNAGLKQFNLSVDVSSACTFLSGVVHSYLQLSTTGPTPYPIIPDGSQAIFISSQHSILGGAQTQASDIKITESGDYFGVRFYPGVLRHFVDMNVSKITDQFVDSHFFESLHHKIYQVQNFKQRVRICEQWLLQQFKPKSVNQFDYALSLIYQSFGNIKIEQLATKVGWSSRHLNRVFHYNIGVSTKTFLQVMRLQQACRQLFFKPDDAINTAFKLGFFDQAHLLNDLKKRLLSNPRLYFKRFMSDFYNT